MAFLDNAADDEGNRIVEGFRINQAEARDARKNGDDRETWYDVQVRYRVRGMDSGYTEADLSDVAYSSLSSLYELADLYRAVYLVMHADAITANPRVTKRVYFGASDLIAIEILANDATPDASAQEDERRSKFHHPANAMGLDG